MRRVYVRRWESPVGEMILGVVEGKVCLCDWASEKRRLMIDNRIRRILNAEYCLLPPESYDILDYGDLNSVCHSEKDSIRDALRTEKAEYTDILDETCELFLRHYERDAVVIGRMVVELDEYFAGVRREFDLPVQFAGTDFQCRVWQELTKIPYGGTATYGGIARSIGNAAAVRAVANAVATNPISIFVPCHRVIGSNGKLTGYAGGLEAKQALLSLENPNKSLFS